MTLKKRYDNIIVGSSPLMLIEAFYLSKLGKTSLIIEKNKVIGGSWQIFSQESVSDQVEVGCHIWYRDKKCFNFLNEVFDLDIAKQEFQPKVYRKNKYWPYYMINLFVLLKSIPKLNSFHEIRSFKNTLTLFCKDFLKIGKFHYPLSGSFGFIQGILNKLKEQDVDILSNSEISEIDLFNKKVILKDGKSIIFVEQVVGTNKSEFKSILDINGASHSYTIKLDAVCNFYLVFSGYDKQTISYVGVWDDEAIYRVSDVTYLDEKMMDQNKRILCVQTFEEFYTNSTSKKEILIIQKLIKMGVIDNENNVDYYFWKPFYYNNHPNDSNARFNKQFKPYIRLMNSHNLILSFSQNYDRWKEI